MVVYLALFALLVATAFLIAKIWPTIIHLASSTDKVNSHGELRRGLGPTEAMLELASRAKTTPHVTAVLQLNSTTSLLLEYVEDALEILKNSHELLQCAIVDCNHLIFQNRMYFKKVSGINIEMILERSKMACDQWQEAWEETCNVVFDSANGPLWKVILLEENFDEHAKVYQNTVIFICHHSIVDGISTMNLLKQFTEYLNSVSKSDITECPKHYYPIPTELHSLIEGQSSALLNCFPVPQFLAVVRKMVSVFFQSNAVVENGGFFVKFPPVCRSFQDKHCTSRTRVIYTKLPEELLTKLLQHTRLNSCTITGVIATASHFVLAQLIDNEAQSDNLQFRWVCPVNARGNCLPRVDKDSVIGDYATVIFQTITICQQRNMVAFWDLARKTSDKLRQDINNGSHLTFLRLIDGSNDCLLHDSDLETGNFAISFISNIGRIDWSEQNDVTYKMIDAFFVDASQRFGHTFKHCITTVNGRMHIAIVYNPCIVLETTTKRYSALLAELLKTLVDQFPTVD